MGWIGQLRGKTVGLDTAPLIYFIEQHPSYLATVRPFFQGLDGSEFTVVTSMITLLEVLIRPLREGNGLLVNEYRDILFNTPRLVTLPLSQDIAEAAARLRAIHNIRIADAVQIASALSEGASFFVTNDARLPVVPGLTMLTLDELRAKS